jgi:VWFA-related protein
VVISSLTVAGLLLAAAGQEPPSFATAVEVVYLDVFVTRGGEPVRGLGAENFVVKDGGVPQRVRVMDLDDVPVGVILVFDTSASLAGEGLRHLQEGGRAVLDALRKGDQAALITFDYSPRLRVGLTSEVARLRPALEAIEARGSTSLYDGLYAGLALPAGGARPLVVMFTDGNDTASWLTADQVLEQVARSQAVIQVVAVEGDARSFDRYYRRLKDPGAKDDPSQVLWLRQIAEQTGGLYWTAEATNRLKATFLKILDDMAQRYLLSFEPEGVPLQGVHELEVQLAGAKGDVRARKRYVIR